MIESTEISDSTPPVKDETNHPPLRPFLDYAARSRARPSLIIKSYGEKNEDFAWLFVWVGIK